MRRFMWFVVGFAAACAFGIYLFFGTLVWIPMTVCLAAAIVSFVIRKDLCRMTALALLGCVAGFAWLGVFEYAYLSTARDYDDCEGNWEIRICDYGQQTQYGVGAEGKILLDGRSFRVRVFLDEEKDLAPGDTVEGEFSLHLTLKKDKDGFSNVVGNGIYLYAYQVGDVKATAGDDTKLAFAGVKLRRVIRETLEEAFPEDTLGFACALLLGDSSLLEYETDTAFAVSGIRHIIAVSGLHISILFTLLYTAAGKNRTLTALLGIPVLLLFAAVAGFTPSVTRACVMQVLMILAMLVKADYDGPTALAFAVFMMLLVNPMAVTSVSLQLSTLCVMGIFLFSGKIHSYLLRKSPFGPGKGKSFKDKCVRWAAGSVSVSLSTMILTTPLCAFYFDTVSLVGILTNLLTLWVVSFIFYGIILVFLLYWLSPVLAGVVAVLVSLPIKYVELVAKLLSRIPFAAVYTYSIYIVIWLVFAYLLLFAFMILKKKHPLVLLSGVAVSLAICIAASCLEPRMDDFRVTVLDVGQGQCILLQSRGRNYMVDCGAPSGEIAADKAAKTLLSQGITKLDGLILTHFDSDHAGGAQMLLTRIPAEVVYLPEGEGDTDVASQIKEQAGDSVHIVRKMQTLEFSDVTITLIPGEENVSENESSMCVLFQPQKYDILITGDRGITGERTLLTQIQLPELELLIAGHHGAQNATGLELLMQTKPKEVVISVGENNVWGHPHQEVLERLSWLGCRVRRTDQEGTILYRG